MGVAVLLLLAFASSGRGANAQSTIGEIEVVGNKVLSRDAIIALTGHKIGHLCTGQVLKEMRDRLVSTANFGMHHPGKPSEWVKIQTEDSGDGKCHVTITIDENDRVERITITGTGPIKPEEVMKLIHRGAVYNPEDMARDKLAIVNLYTRAGLSVEFGSDLGIDTNNPGTLVVPLVVTKVGEIVVEGADPKLAARILKLMKTQKGDYYSRNSFYGEDRPAIMKLPHMDEVAFFETPIAPGQMRLTVSVHVYTGPEIRAIKVAGNKTLSSEAIIALGRYKVGAPCTTEVLETIRENLLQTGNFGMHRPDRREEWVKVQAVKSGPNLCDVTIAVDENDKVSSITITGSGPIKPDEVSTLIRPRAVYNPDDLHRDTQKVIDLYLSKGWSIEFGSELGIDAKTPGSLLVPVVVTRVEEIVVEGADSKLAARILKQMKTQQGDYFNSQTFYDTDLKAIENLVRGSKITAAENVVGTGRIKLVLTVGPKDKPLPAKP